METNAYFRFYKFFMIYIKDSGKHWKNDFFCDRIDFKLVYTQAGAGIVLAAAGNEKGKR